MNKALSVSILLSAFAVSVPAQVWQARSLGLQTTRGLNAVSFVSSGDGYWKDLVVGDSGTLVRGGQAFVTKSTKAQFLMWDPQASGTTEDLYGTHSGISVGANGKVVIRGSGVSWVSPSTGDTADLNAVYSPNGGGLAWAVGADGTILMTTNSGAAWTKQTSGTIQHLQAVHFVDTVTGWAVGQASTIRKTTNGGLSWSTQTPVASGEFYGVYFTGAATGYLVGSGGLIHKTTNAGASWAVQASGTPEQLHGVHFATAQRQNRPDSLIGCAVGRRGTIVCTGNAGVTWTKETTPNARTLTAVHLFGGWLGTQAVAVGDSGTILVRDEVTGSIRGGGAAREYGLRADARFARFRLATAALVSLELTGLDGRALWRSAPALRAAGKHAVRLPAKLPSGMALLAIRVGDRQSIARVLLT